ncbi:MAG: mechanosensitive ion channel family protein [Thermodesulfobacteriota bacterium]|nr:mechanosensitive ion channel family protein [Thermodesulfobacteriota bacterium]
MLNNLLEFSKKFISELKDPWLWLFVAAAGLLIFVIFASRFVARIAPFKNHQKVIWAIDIVFIPSFILCIESILKKIVGPETITFIRNIELVSASILWLVGAWLLTRGLKLFLWGTTFKEKTGAESPLLIRSLVAAAIYFVAFYGIWTSVFGREVTGLLVSTGIIAAVLGLALQSVLSDLFSGLAITIENPFSVGDWIELKDGTIGKVVDITWRSTRLLSWNNSIYVVPNNIAASSIIHNYDQPEKPYAYWTYISVDADIPSGIVLQFLLEAALTCKSVLRYPSPVVRLSDATTQPFKYMIYVYFQDFNTHWAGKSALFSNIVSYLTKAGISPAAVKYEIDTREAPTEEVRRLSVLEHLHEINIFKPLSEDDIETIAGSSEIKTFHPGEMVIQKDDTDNSLFIISSGVVSILENDGMGQHMEIARLGTSECFGEMSLLTGEPRTAIVKALTSVEVINVPKEALEPVLKAKPELSDKLAQIMADRRARTEAFIDSIRKSPSLATTRSYVTKIRSFFGLDIV